jgi:hypothetical protein
MRRGFTGLLAVAASLGAAPVADAAYTGSVDAGQTTAALSGSGSPTITTSGGVLHHSELGPGFASETDFDSTAAGDQTVPDSGRWTLNVTGGGKDTLTVQEGEPAGPLSFAFGHTFFPGGVPCVVRDPNDRGGGVSFSRHPEQETRFCYPSGFGKVVAKAGAGNVDFTVLDTEPGVALYLVGGPGADEATEAANVPSSVDEDHNPASPVNFSGGPGPDGLTLNDGPATAPATYKVADGAIRKTGLPALTFDATVEGLTLYPQDGPSKITVGRTNGASLQVFGGFFRQHGPDVIDASGADAPLILTTGSMGDDTIRGSVFQDYLDGGGGDDTIDSRDGNFDQVACNGTGTVKADTIDMLNDCPSGKATPPRPALWKAKLTPKKVKRGKKVTFGAVATLAGKVTLRFKRGHGRSVKKTIVVKQGPNTVELKPPGKLKRGKYSVSAALRAGGKTSPSVKLSLTVR